ncbi:hypothetical protein WA588_005099, partial [Blastocystis sp. NMH]
MKQKSSGLEGARGSADGRRNQKEEEKEKETDSTNLSSLQSLFQLSEAEWADEEPAEEKIVPVSCAHSDLPLHIAWSSLSTCSRFRHDKKTNEDRVIVEDYSDDRLAIVVACVIDGHAGDYAADFVASVLGKRLNAKFRSILCDHDISPSQSIQESLTQAIKDSFAYVDRRLCQSIFQLLPSSFYQQGTYFTGNMRTAFRHDFEKHIKTVRMDGNKDEPKGRIRGSGCVCACLIMLGSMLFLAGLGDCGILLKRLSGWENVLPEHHPTESDEKERIKKAGGYVKKNGISGVLAVSRAFGDISYKESYYNMSKKSRLRSNEDIVVPTPFVRCVDVDDTFQYCVMGSDGLFNALKKETVINKVGMGIRNGLSGEEICKEVVKMAELEYDKSYMRKE